MATIDNIWSTTAKQEKYDVNMKVWTIDNAQHQHIHHFPTSSGPYGAGKYESLPNFIGGLYVDNGILMLKKEDDSTVALGKAGDHTTLEELMYNILDRIYSDEA